MKGPILHILAYDKFCKPFISFINKEFDSSNHIFLFTTKPDEDALAAHDNVRFLHSPYRSNFVRNFRIFKKCIRESVKIILHGNPALFYFLFFPSAIRKIYWVILGYELGESSIASENTRSNTLHSRIKDFVLKRVPAHISHIKGDSELANVQQQSNAVFLYSPIYPSNVVSKDNTPDVQGESAVIRNIMVGNSTSDTNDHLAIFEMLQPFAEKNITIYCPLSYGSYDDYRDMVIRKGTDMFGSKFVPITQFMSLEEYNLFIRRIDVAIFNHKRQEAMGVTLALLNMQKIVYMNAKTTAFKSLNERSILVFDNELIRTEGLFVKRKVSSNPGLVYENYSVQKLKDSWTNIFNH